MRTDTRGLWRAVTFILIASLLACPLAGSALLGIGEQAYAEGEGRQIEFTPNMATLQVQATPQPTPVATIGPGAYHDASDANRPDVEYIEGGDEQFGYGPVEGYPGLYAMWITDENGTHYFLTDEGSEQLFGTIDPVTQSRREDGFVHFIQQRDEKVKEIEDKGSDVLAEQNNRVSSHILALAIAGVGGLACTVLTGGA